MSGHRDRPISSKNGHDQDSSRENRLNSAMEEYRAELDAGQSINRPAFLARYADIAAELSDCLAGMEIIQAVSKQVSQAHVDHAAAESPPAHSMQSLGDFRIVREIGRGGMAVVYEAEQMSLGRTVALKVLPFAAMLDDKRLQRFKNEARAAATMSHPHIVPVYFVGSERGVHFFAMQLIQGHSLAEIIAATRQVAKDLRPENASAESAVDTEPIAAISTDYSSDPKRFFRSVAQIGVQIAQALSHAHEHGILHRDVKPSNILIDQLGKAWIVDFGLARFDTEGSMTVSGDFLGTLRYMSPEQASGKHQLIDHRADVFSLGTTLYELASLRPAFDGDNREELFQRITAGQPPSLRSINPTIPHELETIIHKAIEKEPIERYASVQEFGEDLRRYLDHEPIKAQRPTLLTRALKWTRRNNILFVSSTLMLTILLVVSGVALYFNSRERTKTAAALKQAEENFDVAIKAVDDMYLELATRWFAAETPPTLIQQDFLRRARSFYEKVARGPVISAQDRAKAARVHERIGQIENYLENYAHANEAVQRAIDFGEMLIAGQPANYELRSELPKRYRLRAEVLTRLSDLPQATSAYQRGLDHLETWQKQGPLPIRGQLEQVRSNHGLVRLFLRTGQIEDAESHLQDSRQRIDDAPKNSPSFRLVDIEHELLSATVLLMLGDISAARDKANSALASKFRRDWEFGEERRTIGVEAQLVELLGQIAESEGDFSRAAERYQESLEIKRRVYASDKEPSQLILTTRLMGERGPYEESSFCSYIETHLRLVRVLLQLDRPYEAEYRLGQCMLASYVIAAKHQEIPRYYVAEANTWALIWQALRQRRPSEATVALDHAILIWREALSWIPHAADYQSGVHGIRNDLDWFRSHLDHVAQARLDMSDPLPRRTRVRPLPEMAFRFDATGRSEYDAGNYKVAIGWLKKSAEQRQADRACAWLHLAKAHARLDELAKAREWFKKAIDEMSQTPNPHVELIELRESAQGLIDDRSSQDRNDHDTQTSGQSAFGETAADTHSSCHGLAWGAGPSRCRICRNHSRPLSTVRRWKDRSETNWGRESIRPGPETGREVINS